MDSQYPADYYVNVACNPINAPHGNLNGGTGTYNDGSRVFSCGTFNANDRPVVGATYNLSGNSRGVVHFFNGWKCTHSGATSDFKES